MNEEWEDKSPLTTKSSGARFWDNTNHLTPVQGIITAPSNLQSSIFIRIHNYKNAASFREAKKSIS